MYLHPFKVASFKISICSRDSLKIFIILKFLKIEERLHKICWWFIEDFSKSMFYLSSIFFKKNKWYAQSIACHQVELMKDRHVIILNLLPQGDSISSSEFVHEE